MDVLKRKRIVVENEDFNSGRSYKGEDGNLGGYSEFEKRKADVSAIEERLESLIVRVGEKSTSSLESNLEGLTSVLESDLTTYKSKILTIILECVVSQPDKTTVYSTLVGLLNAKSYSFGAEFVEMLVSMLKERLKSDEWENCRYIVRFIADLVNCHVVSATSLLTLFDAYTEAMSQGGVGGGTGGDSTGSERKVPQVRSDWFAYAILSSLPWVGRELYEKRESDLDRLLGSIEGYIKGRKVRCNHTMNAYHTALRVFQSDSPHPQEEYLECLWYQIKRLRSDLWVEKHIVRPYLAFESILSRALQHNLPPSASLTPPAHHQGKSYPIPRVIFRLFDYTDCPEGPILPGQHSIERFLIEEQIYHTLKTFHLERKECAAQLLMYPMRNKVPLEYMIVEVMFGEMFKIPKSDYPELCYGSILIELCKLEPATVPQVLAQATESLFERIDHMNLHSVDRFISWFAYHLSNFQFRWSWEDWNEILKQKPDSPKPLFVKEVLVKCMRLSYHNRIVDVLPSTFSDFYPEKPEIKFKFTDSKEDASAGEEGDHSAKQLSIRISKAIQDKCTNDYMLGLIESFQVDTTSACEGGVGGSSGGGMLDNVEGGEDNTLLDSLSNMNSDEHLVKISVFVQSLLYLARKSFSHSFSALVKFRPTLKNLCSSEERQICVLTSIHEIWSCHQQMIVVLVDKLLKMQVVECSCVANWIFSKSMAHDFNRLYVWEILNLTIRMMNVHVNKLDRELNEAKKCFDDDDDYDDEDDSDNENTSRRKRTQRTNSVDDMIESEKGVKPTEEEIESMEEKLESVQADQKNLFLIIFQRFIMILSEHLVRCDTDNVDFKTNWFYYTIGRLRQIFISHHEQVEKYSSTLQSLLFTQDVDVNILQVFNQFQALRM